MNPPLNARDTMNTVQRMEFASKAGCIHVSKSTKELLPKERWEHTSGIEVGELGIRHMHKSGQCTPGEMVVRGLFCPA